MSKFGDVTEKIVTIIINSLLMLCKDKLSILFDAIVNYQQNMLLFFLSLLNVLIIN